MPRYVRMYIQDDEAEGEQDAAFYPSVYGESLDRIMDLQSRSYPDLKIPVILPFLADGILALGGLASEGIFRVPGDADSVSELKSRMDRGHYQLVRFCLFPPSRRDLIRGRKGSTILTSPLPFSNSGFGNSNNHLYPHTPTMRL